MDDEAHDEDGSVNEGNLEETAYILKKPTAGPVTIWIGVFPNSTSPTTAHDAAQSVLALLAGSQITDIDIDFRESLYRRQAGPRLLSPVNDLDPLANVISPLTPALGLHISTTASQGTMALYLAEGGESNRLLGLTCNHVLFNSVEGRVNYAYHPGLPAKSVVLLGRKGYAKLAESVKLQIARHGISVEYWRKQIQSFIKRGKGNDPGDVAKAERARIKTQALLDNSATVLAALADLLNRVEEWENINDCDLGHIILAPAIGLGVGKERFTEDWGVFHLSREKLGQGFQGNKIDLGAFSTIRLRPSAY